MGGYQYTRYTKASRPPAKLVVTNDTEVRHTVAAIYRTRDLINTPSNDLGPRELAQQVKALAKPHQAKVKVISGEAIRKECPAIYAVGKSSENGPRLIELNWGKAKNPSVTLVGKGVCFDSGGLDIKPAAFMLHMKKRHGWRS